jgi:thioredoxin 1
MSEKNRTEEVSKPEEDELQKIRLEKTKALLGKSNRPKTESYPSMPVKVSDGDFNKFIHQYPVVVVDFWADWCGPCHMLAPTINELAKYYSGKIAFGKLNIDENQDTALNFMVMGVPTLLILKNGEEVDRIVGVAPRNYIESKLTGCLR